MGVACERVCGLSTDSGSYSVTPEACETLVSDH